VINEHNKTSAYQSSECISICWYILFSLKLLSPESRSPGPGVANHGPLREAGIDG